MPSLQAMRDKPKDRNYLSEVRKVSRETIQQARTLREESRRTVAKSKAAAEARKRQRSAGLSASAM